MMFHQSGKIGKGNFKLINNPKTISELQKVELGIFKQVVSVCEIINVKYYIIGGTLLGAIRHKGFIPWDDDIDIAMFREDYEKFCRIAPEYLDSNLLVQNKLTDKRIHLGFTKIRKIGTELIEFENENFKSHKGISIDIFPLDKTLEKDHYFLDFLYLIFKAFQAISLYKNGYRNYRRRVIKVFSFIFSLIPYKAINLYSEKVMTLFRNSNSEFYTSYSSGYGYKKYKLHRKNVYGDGVMVLFEDIQVRAPSNYEVQLVKLYGDYMKLPSIEKRGIQHNIIKVDFNTEYKGEI